MEIKEAILSAGTEAIKTYRDISGGKFDNEVHERFVSSLMAVEMHKRLACIIKVEQQYTQIADDLELRLDRETRRRITGLATDIAVYDGQRPVAVIEVKIHDESHEAGSIRDDLHKGDIINLCKQVEVYAGAMVCQVANQDLAARKQELEGITGCHWIYADPITARDGYWHWCFGCGYTD